MPDAIVAADWNGDAAVDLAVVALSSGDLTSLVNDGAGRFTLKATTALVGAMPRSLKVADFNTDGTPDLVTATFLTSTVSVLQGRGDGTFAPAANFWAGDEPTSVEVGLFDNDKRPDVVAGRLRDDELALLINEPRPDDGLIVTRDIPYVPAAGDPTAAHHTLDVWAPAKGTPSFAGPGRRYPVFVFAHGGFGVAGDKTGVSYLMRSLALEGIIAVSIDYRIDGLAHYGDTMTDDYADAFRWVRANIGAPSFFGDPDNIVVGGTSTGAAAGGRFTSSPLYAAEHPHIRGFAVIGASPTNPVDAAAGAVPPPSIAVAGDQGGEARPGAGGTDSSRNFITVVQARGAYGKFVQVPGRDHFTLVANVARPGDLGRAELLAFLQRVLR